jgi:hypothetical protein
MQVNPIEVKRAYVPGTPPSVVNTFYTFKRSVALDCVKVSVLPRVKVSHK